MATIKSFTDLSQSKTLSKILPLESADMYYDYDVQKHEYYPMVMDDLFEDNCVRAWSLAALLSVLPKGTDIVKEESDTENERYMCTVGIKDDIISTFANNPVDACVAMIEKLHKLNLL